MGYLTDFTISLEEGSVEDFRNVLEQIEQKSGYQLDEKNERDAYLNDARWYDCVPDCTSVSKRFPLVIFMVEGHGENWDDNWRARFHAGEYEWQSFTWPPFQKIRTTNETR